MKPLYCTEDCLTQCRACAETESINNAHTQRQIEERERRYDDAFPCEPQWERDK